ncbi:MAG: phosphoribosylamine--glycine ligase [Acidobacteria bacterium]|nr:phosphoribosylamine--glycine ligase [Acidobacteriota bacterium]
MVKRKVLVVGSGGREHALVWKLAREGWDVWAAPGNAGMRDVASCIPVKATDLAVLTERAAMDRFDLVVIGPEQPLTLGLADRLSSHSLAVFGPRADAARIEGSKIFAKRLMEEFAVPTAGFRIFESPESALEFIASPPFGYPLVVKADGLAAGKGVVVAGDRQTASDAVASMMVDHKFGGAGDRIIIEECLTGTEVSFFALAYGAGAVPLGSAQDYKRLLDGDRGPNTGGMGSISPSPLVDSAVVGRIMETVVLPVVEGMSRKGCEFRGLLYAGLMMTPDGPKVLEFNCRFGDPETQPLMLTLENGLGDAMAAVARGERPEVPAVRDGAAVCVVMASSGYPETPEVGKAISGLDVAESKGAVVFHAGTVMRDGHILTSGGRVLAVCAWGGTRLDARQKAYEGVSAIGFEGMQCRGDIASGC